MNLGDEVEVIDTSNGRKLQAYVRRTLPSETEVYVVRFGNNILFDQRGITAKGRFKLGKVVRRAEEG